MHLVQLAAGKEGDPGHLQPDEAGKQGQLKKRWIVERSSPMGGPWRDSTSCQDRPVGDQTPVQSVNPRDTCSAFHLAGI